MHDSISLSQLNLLVKKTLQERLNQRFKVVAEISEMNENRGHAYLELAEKDPETGRITAKARAVIWASFYGMIKSYFKSMTGDNLAAGMKILVSVSVEFHEIYGYSLNISDIDPSYTLGDIERRRIEIIRKLEADGVLDMNKELPLPIVPLRIAVVSSETAAGYGDFLNQLKNNEFGYVFKVSLFPAILQGENAQHSIIEALDRIFEQQKDFDVVAIIRGGGSKFDLSCFDDYELALNITQFPLPVLTGIGHERDNSVADLAAHTSVKTPTALAAFLISRVSEFEALLNNFSIQLEALVKESVFDKKTEILRLSLALKSSQISRLNEERHRTDFFIEKLTSVVKANFERQNFAFQASRQRLKQSVYDTLKTENYRLNLFEQKIKNINPETILKKGYSITLHKGKILRSAKDVKKGEIIETRLQSGTIVSEVK